MPSFEMLHLLQVISYFRETLQERSGGTYVGQPRSQWKKSPRLEISIFGSWFVVFLNFWLVVIGVEKFLGRGGSWYQCFGLWWLVVAHGGSYNLLDSIFRFRFDRSK